MTKRVSVFIDGYNLYHAIDNLKIPILKWTDPLVVSREFARSDHGFEIIRAKFFTAPPIHKSKQVQERYFNYIKALKFYCKIDVIEGKFKKKLLSYRDSKGKAFTRLTHEEKESDVNIALAILEDSYEKISDKILVITNDSDISPAIRMALEKNKKLKINVITPPLANAKRANYDLINACGDINRNSKGQVFFKTRMISKEHLKKAIMPKEITTREGILFMPDCYDEEIPF